MTNTLRLHCDLVDRNTTGLDTELYGVGKWTWSCLVSDPLVDFLYFLCVLSFFGRETTNDDQKTRQTISARLWLADGAFALAQSRGDIPL